MTDAKHEAPAEGAGVRDDLIARLEEMADFFDGATDPVIAETVCDEHARDLRAVLSVIRARSSAPEAREGVKTLGWFSGLARKHGHHAQADWLDANKHSFTHPAAPSADKLRIAGDALDRIATVDMGGGFLGAEACRQVARQALVALRAEG